MDKKRNYLDWWLHRAWIHCSLCITVLMTAAILVYWNEWSTPVKILAAIAALIPVHVIEEWIFPGGFHYQYNAFAFRSDIPDRYPGCRLDDMLTNVLATLLYVVLALWYVLTGSEVPASLILMTIGFCILEVVIHTCLGFMGWLRFRKAGKTTIYGPGSISAYFGFGVFGVILCYCLSDYTVTGSDWLWAVIELVAMLIGVIVIPETSVMNRNNTRFSFPSAMYYERFIGK